MGTGVAVIGLGRVGLPMSLLLAEKGFQVYGLDISADAVAPAWHRRDAVLGGRHHRARSRSTSAGRSSPPPTPSVSPTANTWC